MANRTPARAAAWLKRGLIISVLMAGLAACANPLGWARGDQSTPFKPHSAGNSTPVIIFAVTPTPFQDDELLEPVTGPECSDGLTFLDDLTIPDGSVVQPGERLDKRWLVENSGNCNWMSDYRLRLVSGPAMEVPAEQALYPARGGVQAELRMLFTAPEEEGLYRSAWQAYNALGEAFGDPFFIEVVVQAN